MAHIWHYGPSNPNAQTSDLPLLFDSVQSMHITTGGRNGKCIAVTGDPCGVKKYIPDRTTTFIGGRFTPTGDGTTRNPFILYDHNGVLQCYITQSASDRKLRFGTNPDGTTVLATSTLALPASPALSYIELKVTIGTPGSYEVRVNGVSTGWIPPASGNTQGAGALSTIGQVYWCGYGMTVCDLYIRDDIDATATQGFPYNDFMGDTRIDLKSASGAGAHTTWTPSAGNGYDCVSDGSDATYVSAAGVQEEDYTYTSMPAGAILTAPPLMRIKHLKSDGGSCTIEPVFNDSTGLWEGTPFSPATTATINEQFIPTNHAGTAMTRSILDAGNPGFKRIT
jgi:hypothetical protein